MNYIQLSISQGIHHISVKYKAKNETRNKEKQQQHKHRHNYLHIQGYSQSHLVLHQSQPKTIQRWTSIRHVLTVILQILEEEKEARQENQEEKKGEKKRERKQQKERGRKKDIEGQDIHGRSSELTRSSQWCRDIRVKIGRSEVGLSHSCTVIQFRFVLVPCDHMLYMINTAHFTNPFG